MILQIHHSTHSRSATWPAHLAHNRTTLVLDSFLDGGAEPLYRALGWTEAGRVPLYAAWPDGTKGTTVYYYKLLA